MKTENSVAKPRTWVRRFFKVLLRAVVSLVALCFIAGAVWKFSGSNRWEYVGEKNGVKVYSLKEPGSDLTQTKAVLRVHSKLARLVKFIQDSESCVEFGCKDSHTLERVDDQLEYDYFRADLPFPFKPREYVIRTQFFQNPNTKEVLMEVAAAPDKIPPNHCCLRVTQMNNTMRLTPLGNGQIEVEYIVKQNDGGFLPHFLLNWMRPKVMFYGLPKLQGYLDKEKFRDAKFAFLKEP
jgi:hypothetical protein